MKKVSYITALCIAVLSISACSSQKSVKPNPIDTGDISYDGINLYFNSSSDGMNEFLNDFTHRNMRYDEYSVGKLKVGDGTGFQKNWETMATSFQNSIAQVYGEDKFQRIANYLLSVDQDDLGLIYNTPLEFEKPDSYASDDAYEVCGYSVPQGWPFPYWEITIENAQNRAKLDYVHTIEFNFNNTRDAASQNWNAINGTFDISGGYGNFSSNQHVSNFMFFREDIDKLLTEPHGIDSKYAAMIDMEISYTGNNVQDYNIIFKVAGDDNWHRAPQSLYSSIPTKNVNGNVHVRQFFDMYLCPEWNRKIITELGVEFVSKTGTTCSVTNGKVNFMRPSPDTRQTLATFQYILALYNYYIFTRDTKTLLKAMNKARKGILFLTHALQGEEKGLLSIEYFYGHDGVVPYSLKDQPKNRLAYHGIANGYWDLCVYPILNLETNTDFYQVLKAMAVLEKALENEPTDNKDNIYVKNRMPTNPNKVKYDYDEKSLLSLAARVKANMEKPINVVKDDNLNTAYNTGDYYYKNDGGFYNPETGRFATGINECTGEILDFGYAYLNMEAIACGIGTEEQQLSIMNWIDGRRYVEGDTSQGDDIYFYEFAARANTKDCDQYLNFYRDENNASLYREGFEGKTWSRLVQNGGAIIAWSYFDIVARAKVLGVDNAVKRLEGIQKWYRKVLDEEGDSYDFYSTYYNYIDSLNDDPDMRLIYELQTHKSGSLGLDFDFIESVIFIRSIPDALFGMDASDYNNLQFTYGDNNRQDFFEIYNLKYGEALYSIRSKKNTMQIFNINGVASKNYTVTFKYKTDNENLKVTVNGEVFEDTEYIDGYIYVTVPFGEVKVIFG